ncbi:TPA: hyaluronoglucosaminidase, partial [Streptococcus pyogenes NGAS737]|nr:hyaluronoglucosaminidase [Streptococcus pyogenes]HER4534969.1 hyaluronoglucosaminidase [Streptococcus pyogenes NGAS737]HEP5595521.1 hyaluronoglucosaminidase [Streptococcus pyogenes]HEP6700251.1 hyaluronoglucosaminidase [Streptococcus pyogenes]HEP6905808.1 hyaluronoglucosaminidase [Streptococcus pyogenes]
MTLEERIPIKVLFDRKDAAEWQKLNPVVDDGELVVELDTHRLKVGDGKLNYNDLPYYEGPQGESITKVQLSENGDLSVWIGDKETKLGNIKGQKGDKGTSIADITKVGETLTITLSDDTQKTFSIPNGQKGDRGKGVE